MKANERIEIAEKVKAKLEEHFEGAFNGKVWCPDHENDSAPVRVYIAKKCVKITEDGKIDIRGKGNGVLQRNRKALEEIAQVIYI